MLERIQGDLKVSNLIGRLALSILKRVEKKLPANPLHSHFDIVGAMIVTFKLLYGLNDQQTFSPSGLSDVIP